MKDYLKMSDVFNMCDVVETDVKVLFAVSQVCDDGVMCHEYAHHAIESHDELVQMNKELLASLKMVVGDISDLATSSDGVCGLHQNGEIAGWQSLFSGGRFEEWLMSINDAERLIAKLNGGDA